MAYIFLDEQLGLQQPGVTTDATAQVPLGSIRRAIDPVYGMAEFIYLQGPTVSLAGEMVVWAGISVVTPTYAAQRLPVTVQLGQPIAIAMITVNGSPFNWFQIGGTAIVITNGTISGADTPCYAVAAATPQVTTSQTNGRQILNSRIVSANNIPTTNRCLVEINRPALQGQIT